MDNSDDLGNGDTVAASIDGAIDSAMPDLVAVADHIHQHPELGFEEHIAHGTLTELCATRGWRVTRGDYGLDTAFTARVGDPNGSGPHVAIICEYDALPGLGHACGHNIIAAAGIGAAIGAAAVVDRLDGRLTVLGTPAEEGGGGKALMIDRGALDGIDIAMMVHPADADDLHMASLAISEVVCTCHGEAAHAAAAPERGRNALDAAVLGYQAVGALRQHIADRERVHGIVTHGGDKPNIVPSRAQTQWYVRSPTAESLTSLRDRVINCLRAGADAAGCSATFDYPSPFYAELVANDPLDDLTVQIAADLGRRLSVDSASVAGSTDMGNVSQRVPSIHPMIKIAPTGTPIHTPGFAEAAASADGWRGLADGARLMAHLTARLWSTPSLAADAAADLAGRMSARSAAGSMAVGSTTVGDPPSPA